VASSEGMCGRQLARRAKLTGRLSSGIQWCLLTGVVRLPFQPITSEARRHAGRQFRYGADILTAHRSVVR